MSKSGVAIGSVGSAAARRTEEPVPAAPIPVASPQDWRPFLRALAAEVDAVAGTEGRDALLRGVGLQLARMYPMPGRDSLDGLAMDMTETLDGFGWGSVQIAYSEREHCLVMTHAGLPRVGGAGEPAGTWLAAVLVGLYEGWMGQQPGSDASLVSRLSPTTGSDIVLIKYGKV